MRKRENSTINIALLDVLTGALGAVIILYVAVPKGVLNEEVKQEKPKELVHIQEGTAQSKEDLEQIKQELAQLKIQNKKLKSDKRKLYKIIDKQRPKPIKKERKISSIRPIDVGFKFKGKKIVFIIDVSGSMYKEDKIGQVKAGLKMLITSMGSDYQIDVIQYPNGIKGLQKPLWSSVKKTTPKNKIEIYRFLNQLRPYGATPTRDVLKYAINNYYDATDIVLLSDGAPTIGNSREFEDIYHVLRDIRITNQGRQRKVQINTIGVGSDFVSESNNNAKVFLKKLAKDHKGFFYGF